MDYINTNRRTCTDMVNAAALIMAIPPVQQCPSWIRLDALNVMRLHKLANDVALIVDTIPEEHHDFSLRLLDSQLPSALVKHDDDRYGLVNDLGKPWFGIHAKLTEAEARTLALPEWQKQNCWRQKSEGYGGMIYSQTMSSEHAPALAMKLIMLAKMLRNKVCDNRRAFYAEKYSNRAK